MKRIYIITFITAILSVAAIVGINTVLFGKDSDKTIKVGFMYVGDESTAYTNNFMKAQKAVEEAYGDQVIAVAKYNVSEGLEDKYFQELVDEKCDIIFATSFGYADAAKRFAQMYPDIEIVMATGTNANDEPELNNYHTFMGEIYQGRYTAGVAAGMKIKELIDSGVIDESQAKAGYVGAYPYAEVISGYTAFILGVRSVVPQAHMIVKYTNSWSNYTLEKRYAKELIDEGCVIISQHSDTAGPAVACEQTDAAIPVYLVSYNQSMADIAPTTYLTGSKINWSYYMIGAVGAVLEGKSIESTVDGKAYGNDMMAGFEKNWIEMLDINEVVAAPGTKQRIEAVCDEFRKGQVHVFSGNYMGVSVDDKNDTCNLNEEYIENYQSSAPTFNYILNEIITIE